LPVGRKTAIGFSCCKHKKGGHFSAWRGAIV